MVSTIYKKKIAKTKRENVRIILSDSAHKISEEWAKYSNLARK